MQPNTAQLLIVDDDEAVGRVLAALLAQAGYRTTWVASAEAALTAIDKRPYDMVLSDVRMPGASGLDLLRTLRQRFPELPVVLLTAHATVTMAVEAMREGASDFIQKPFEREEILFVVKKVLSIAQPEAPSTVTNTPDGMVGTSSALDEAKALIRQAAPTQATVLILGETGTGKELVAKAIHAQSPRAKSPFVRLNCGALPDNLFESELFGYEKGAFTGAVQRKPGRVELAQGGTLFLDEVGELSLTSQVKLLRLLQEKEFERLGGTETLKADTRIIAATHRALPLMVKEGTFREDLYYRLNVVPISLPPLRARAGDVELLAKHFTAALGAQHGKPQATLTPEAVALLQRQAWPGNVRQLQHFIERLIILTPGNVLDETAVQRELERADMSAVAADNRTTTGESLPERRQEAERQALLDALKQAGGNRSLAARLLGISRRTLYNKMDALGLET